MEAQKQTDTLNALTPIIDNGNGWFKRTAHIGTLNPLTAWHQTKSVLESLDKYVGKKVSFFLSPDGTKVKFANIRDGAVWPFEDILKPEQKPMAREDYWREKEKRDIAWREENIRHHYESLIAPGVWKTVPEGATLDEVEAAIVLIQEKAKELHGAGI